MKEIEKLDEGTLYDVNENHVILVYDSSDATASFYEGCVLVEGTSFIVIDNSEELDNFRTSLILHPAGIGRIVVSDKFYNSLRMRKLI